MKKDEVLNYLITGRWKGSVNDCLVSCRPNALSGIIMGYVAVGLDPDTMNIYEIKRHVHFRLVREVISVRTDG